MGVPYLTLEALLSHKVVLQECDDVLVVRLDRHG